MAKKKTTTTKTVKLLSGGQVTLSAKIDALKLSPDDREFVFGLLDQLVRYKEN